MRTLLPDQPGPWPPELASIAGRILGRPPQLWERRWRDALAEASSRLAQARSLGIRAIESRDDGYPPWLRQLPDAPILLWYRGHLDAIGVPGVAIVGSRDASPLSLMVARRLGRDLAAAGITVISGMARGVDAAAHEGALEAGRTVGILGCGIDVDYPRGHRPLSDRIARTGLILSEFEPGRQPRASLFPMRNRIISGLSRAVVVVEASERSGSLITARMALEQGRDVLAVPGAVASGRHRGCHALIKDGARLVETVDDVLEEIGWRKEVRPTAVEDGKSFKLNEIEQVMAPGEAYTVDDLATRTGRQASDLLADLGSLELAGRVSRVAGGGFLRLD